jgi:DnaJ-class molecular chaperone
MVKISCPVCNGKGRVPISFDGPMIYYNPHTGESWPHKICPGCGGSGIQEDKARGD